ncbi:endonuclease I family protein [Fervidibacillus halotolerans]|uniref:Endonuclease n=1 Tax=Fervidibacillus halotolerans TaxID=2980027 RepID=A0A9E8M0C7_9BACI|nr:endonuclease [Fervidibacillus halotolerans]WAA12682.1 endonuclease [Fervidibacillus halotolerans]
MSKRKRKTYGKYIPEFHDWKIHNPSRLFRMLLQNQEKICRDPSLYYNPVKDERDIHLYYKPIKKIEKKGKVTFSHYHKLVKKTHKNQLPYYISKDQYLYAWVDLQPDGTVKSIYSNEKNDPNQLIEKDYHILQKRYEQFQNLFERRDREESSLLETIKTIDYRLKYNTEHIVPQSWFHAQQPMKSDLHHLFVCHPECNVRRANYPYTDFSFYQPESPDEIIRNRCGVVKDERFEPEYGKGAVARATFYFLLRYPKAIRKKYLKQIDFPILVNWHDQFPVDLYEKHRNQAIYEIQGNRNPFIDFPNLIHQLEFPNIKR